MQFMYLGIHLKSLGLCILNLVMSKFRCISLWERAKYRTYVPELIFVQFNSHSPPAFFTLIDSLSLILSVHGIVRFM